MAFLAQIACLVKGVRGGVDGNLVRQHQRAAAKLQHVAQRDQRTVPAIGAVRGGAERKDAVPIGRKRRLRRLPHAGNPVERVLEQQRDRSVVFGARNEDAMMAAE